MNREQKIKIAKKVVNVVGTVAVASVVKLVIGSATGDNVRLIKKGLYVIGGSIIVGMTRTPVGAYVDGKFDEFVNDFELLKSNEVKTEWDKE